VREEILEAALGVFLVSGFHAATTEELGAATGRSWDDLRAEYVDKEGLFLAAVEHRLTGAETSPLPADEAAAVADLLRRVTAAGSTVRLRAQHRDALQRLARLAEAAARG
jgi:AcrR family transcriptional regulator